MQRTACGLELLPAPSEIDRVVTIPSIRRTATHAHKPARAQLTQVVRHQALPLAEELRQLANRAVAANELAQQQPPQGMRQKSHEPRWTTSGAV
jgi:hypothetical protein